MARARGTLHVEDPPTCGSPAPARPYLYTALVKFGQDEYRQQFGFRSVEVRGHQFLINGEPFYFKRTPASTRIRLSAAAAMMPV